MTKLLINFVLSFKCLNMCILLLYDFIVNFQILKLLTITLMPMISLTLSIPIPYSSWARIKVRYLPVLMGDVCCCL